MPVRYSNESTVHEKKYFGGHVPPANPGYGTAFKKCYQSFNNVNIYSSNV